MGSRAVNCVDREGPTATRHIARSDDVLDKTARARIATPSGNQQGAENEFFSEFEWRVRYDPIDWAVGVPKEVTVRLQIDNLCFGPDDITEILSQRADHMANATCRLKAGPIR